MFKKVHGNKGNKRPDLSEYNRKFKKNQIPWNKDKKGLQIAWNKGKTAKEDTRIATGIRNGMYGKTSIFSILNKNPEFISKTIRGRIKRPTSLERKMLQIIEKNKLTYKYVGDGSFLIGFKNPDFVNVNGEKIAIEVYAEVFKRFRFGNVKKWKLERQKVFAKYGWKILFFDETQVNEEMVKVLL